MNGVIASDECFTAFNQMKLKKTDRFIIFKLTDDQSRIEVEKRGGPDASFDDFVAALPDKETRWAALALSVQTKSGATDPHRLIFVSWVSSGSPIRAKMMHAASKAALKGGLEGLSGEIHASAVGELQFEEVYLKAGGVLPATGLPAAA